MIKMDERSNLPLVSVIIPAYNSAKFLEACIQSVIEQTYHKIEVIIVNDGSTDNSESIIDRYMNIDTRIIKLTKRNEGLPAARRSGIDIARGKYIQHLDSDDTLLHDALECLVARAESTGADIVNANFLECYPKMPQYNSFPAYWDFGEMTGIMCLKAVFLGKIYWTVWANFQKRSLFQNNNIELVPHISYGEDAVLMTQLLVYSKKVVSLDKVILNYNRYETSMSYNQGEISDKKFHEFVAFPIWIDSFVTKIGLKSKLRKEIAFLFIRNFFLAASFRRFSFCRDNLKSIMAYIRLFPELKGLLDRRKRKVLRFCRLSNSIGMYFLRYYIKKGKL